MTRFSPFEPQPEPRQLVLPTYIIFQAATATKSVYLCAYCNTQLICAMHPYGVSEDTCQDWVALDV